MQVEYNSRTDLLYLRLDDEQQTVVNRRVSDDVVLDVGPNDRLVGIEIMEASRHVRMEKLLPVTYEHEHVRHARAAVREGGSVYRTRSKRGRKQT